MPLCNLHLMLILKAVNLNVSVLRNYLLKPKTIHYLKSFIATYDRSIL
jgi:hypothetical protein